MKEKFKRYLVIIPAVFVLLLSCVPMLGAHAEEDYSSYHHDPEQFTNFDQIFSLENVQQTLSNNIQSFTDSDYYYYMVYKDQFDYQYHPDSFKFYVMYFSLSSDTPLIDNDDYSVYCVSSFYSYTYYENPYNFDATFSNFSDSPNSDGYYYFLVYDKVRDQAFWQRSSSSTISPVRFPLVHLYLVDSNLSEFGGSSLNVSVNISPSLSGVVDTSVTQNGVSSDSPYLNCTVINNSRFPIQYFIAVVEHGYSVFPTYDLGTTNYGSYVYFVSISEEWRNVAQLNTDDNLYHLAYAMGNSPWHMCNTQAASIRCFRWSQMNLKKNKTYDFVVYAFRNDSGRVYNSRIPTIQLDPIQEVYRSSFSLKKDTEYDPSCDSFGNVPFEVGDTVDLSSISQYYDPNTGDLVPKSNHGSYSINDVFNGSQPYNYDSYTPSGYTRSNFSSLSQSISGFLLFFNGVWSYIPGNYTALIGLSITALVVVAIFKGVFR